MRDSPFREVELKLRATPQQLSVLRKSPLLTSLSPARPKARRLLSHYYDTPDRALRAAGMVLRVRQDGASCVQTVKVPAAATGHHVADEFEAGIAGPGPELAAIPEDGLRRRLEALIGSRTLDRLFETDIRRTVRLLTTQTGDVIELALDVGEIRAAEASEPVCELEFELKAGRPEALYAAAERFVDAVPLIVDPRTKSDRGYQLAGVRRPQAEKAGTLRLPRRASVGEALGAIVADCARQILANEWAVREGDRVEGVHQMRVGLRRLRAALSIFKPVLGPDGLALLASDARWLASVLGAQRDLDVFEGSLLAPVSAAFPGSDGVRRLSARVRQGGEAARREILAALQTERYAQFVFDLSAGLALPPERSLAPRLDEPARDFAARVLAKRWRKARAHGKRIASLSVEERHIMRIELKKLRYAVEFFGGLFPAAPVRKWGRRLSELQDIFGLLNDVASAEALLARMLAGEDEVDTVALRAENMAAGLVLGWHHARAESAWKTAMERWAALGKAERFWTS
ncbi:MAG: CYTH and CHAD domain-containing protein [Alphaproteobacteria bacterium]|nr:CYTH and CHAD domain-containing protein [Alphaproteobacteria bacterium]